MAMVDGLEVKTEKYLSRLVPNAPNTAECLALFPAEEQMVKRFKHFHEHVKTSMEEYVRSGLISALDGDFVRFADYKKLEAALREIADFAEQFIGDDEDGDERMYKVHQIADNAIPFTSDAEVGGHSQPNTEGKV
jgi:hypothetical protein